MTAEAKPFVRRVEIPPGAPWDQYRAARLDGALGAPLPLDQVAVSIRRLDPWRPRKPARYAIAYARRSEITATRDIESLVDGRLVTFRFRPEDADARNPRALAITLGLAVGAVLALMAAGQHALAARAEDLALLGRLEAGAARADRIVARQQEGAADRRLLRGAGAERSAFIDLATDLAWLGEARKPSARLRSVTWTPRDMVVVSEGRDLPISGTERAVEAQAAMAATTTWRVGPPPPPTIKGGVIRPSVIQRPAASSAPGRRP